jgi:hypothetical protein
VVDAEVAEQLEWPKKDFDCLPARFNEPVNQDRRRPQKYFGIDLLKASWWRAESTVFGVMVFMRCR